LLSLAFGSLRNREQRGGLPKPPRFYFGDVRVIFWVTCTAFASAAPRRHAAGKVNALYQFEVLASPRGKSGT